MPSGSAPLRDSTPASAPSCEPTAARLWETSPDVDKIALTQESRFEASGRQQPQLMCARHGLEARVRPELPQDVAYVIPHRLLAQVEHGGDVLRRCTLTEQLQNLVLAGRQAHRSGSDRPGWAQDPNAEHGVTDVSARNED